MSDLLAKYICNTAYRICSCYTCSGREMFAHRSKLGEVFNNNNVTWCENSNKLVILRWKPIKLCTKHLPSTCCTVLLVIASTCFDLSFWLPSGSLQVFYHATYVAEILHTHIIIMIIILYRTSGKWAAQVEKLASSLKVAKSWGQNMSEH